MADPLAGFGFDIGKIPIIGGIMGKGGDAASVVTHWSNKLSSMSNLDMIGMMTVGLAGCVILIGVAGIMEKKMEMMRR